MLCSDADARLQRLINTPPAAVPRPGDILHLAAGDIRWREDETMMVRVIRVRCEISRCYDGAAVWLDVDELSHDGTPVMYRQLLVYTAAIARQQGLVLAGRARR
ncbi:MAG: hypothetical protein AUI14_07285 [Actinobacteria bacterium 13_2_20CM_2_71_6]|nr:MAG: hypothetical protein AUI14_07285 [Actinobacteria bacterium 13_2_20CM_2_71_6]